MRRLVKSIALAVVAVGTFSGAVFAADYSCKKDISVTGNGAFTEDGGKKKAVKAWRDAAIAENGIYFAEEKQANEGTGVVVERCARSSIGLMICQAKGRPCAEKSDNVSECTKGDSKDCDPKSKWIQSKLSKLGYDVTVDGNIGPKTERAIEKFKKDKKISGDTIEAIVEALKKT